MHSAPRHFAGRLNLQPNSQKGGGLDINFCRRVGGKEGGELFESEGSCNFCNFYVKDKLKSEIFNDKKSL